jgi:hypothetical protein
MLGKLVGAALIGVLLLALAVLVGMEYAVWSFFVWALPLVGYEALAPFWAVALVSTILIVAGLYVYGAIFDVFKGEILPYE